MLVVLALFATIFTLALGQAAKDPVKLVSQGDRALRNDDVGEAIRLYSEAIQLQPKDAAKVYYARSKAYVKKAKIASAISDLTEAIAMSKDYVMAHLQRANLRLITGHCTEAVADYETVLRLDPSKRDAQNRLPHARSCAGALERAQYLRNMQNWHGVREALTEAMDVERATSAPALLLQRAEASLALADLEQAMADSARVLKMDQSNLQAYVVRAAALARYGDFTTARNHYQQCLQYDPEYKPCKDGFRTAKAVSKAKERGDQAFNGNRLKEAITAYKDAMAADPDNNVLRRDLMQKVARSYLRLKEYTPAIAAASEVISLDDGNPEAHYVLGQAHLALESWEDANRHAKRAHEIDRGNHEYADGARKAEAALKQSKNKDFYRILGVARDADDRTIKRAYRTLAKEWHPDMHAQDEGAAKEAAERKFRDIAEAYEILSDTEKRQRYDRGEDVSGNGQPQGHPHGHPHGFPFPFGRGGPGGGFSFHFGNG